MKRIMLVIVWTVTFCLLATMAAGLLNGVVIASGLTVRMGDSWAVICVVLTDLILVLGFGLGLYLSLTGRLPGTSKATHDAMADKNQ